MAHAFSPPRKRRLPRPTTGRVAAFVGVSLLSIFLTVTGWALFIGQVATVESFKGAAITIIVQAGLVVVGPLVLWAHLVLMPKGLLTAIIGRLARPLGGNPRV